MDVFAELARFVEPFDASVIEAALLGKASQFDIDGKFHSHHMGHPRSSEKQAFDSGALLAGMQAVCFLGTHLRGSDPLRRGVPKLYKRIVERLSNPDLMIFAGYSGDAIEGERYVAPGYEAYEHHHGIDNGAIVVAHGYTYFRPARLVNVDDIARVVGLAKPEHPNNTFPFSGFGHVWKLVGSPGVEAIVARCGKPPVEHELDARQSAPELVARVQRARELDADAATLYLQLLALADCADASVREINDWTQTEHKKVAAKLVAAKLVNEHKQPRANRKHVLAGTWEKLFPPHPAIERWKLELYDARMQGKTLVAPLGRVVPLRPIHEIFEAAWQRVAGEDAPESNRPTVAIGRDWIAELKATPDDDSLRLVYGDWLAEQGDPRGELVTLQCRRVQLARQGQDMAAIEKAEQALLAKHGDVWAEQIHSYVEGHGYDRGFITSITVHAPTFVKHAKKIVDALPFLVELQLSAGGVGPIPRAHVSALSGCEAFSRITRLDLTPDHYLRSTDELELLVEAPQLPRLKWLRLGFHRGGEGFGTRGAELIAGCARLSDLRFLEIAGQNLELAGVEALFKLKKLEMLRVPYNAIKSGDVDKLIDSLDQLPALRVLDVSNVLETDFVTAACSFFRNCVDLARQHALAKALAARRGAAAQYERDDVKGGPAQGGFVGTVLPQTGKYPFAERAKSGTSKCVVCREKIAMRSVRIGVERMLDAVGKVTSWAHAACRDRVPELQGIPGLDELLTANSRGVWPPEA